jgi:hypothetical protein
MILVSMTVYPERERGVMILVSITVTFTVNGI